MLDDLASGRPMDRLVCGDVGFGKTEVALRAAFCAAINGKQVASSRRRRCSRASTTRPSASASPACRFASAGCRAWSARRRRARPRRTSPKAASRLSIGTHAVLGKGVSFKDLGLVVIDEEQHFGVGHKERLKELRAEVHVLTLSATPIPRTLQLAMTGVRELSIIATPPIDRLAVRSFVSPFDSLIVREALLRERYRGGQAFFVCPRIEDLDEAAAFLRENVPEAKFVIAHGQMSASELEDKMSAFYDGKYDILLSTTIVESGLDIPTRQYADRLARRHVRPRAALPIARSRRALETARLCAVHHAREPRDYAAGAEAPRSAANARYARRRLPAREPRSRHSRRRQSARRRTVRPYQGSRLRALSADAGRCDHAA